MKYKLVLWEFPVLAEGRHIFGLSPKPRAAKDLTEGNIYPPCFTETGNRARSLWHPGYTLRDGPLFFDEVGRGGGGGLEILK